MVEPGGTWAFVDAIRVGVLSGGGDSGGG